MREIPVVEGAKYDDFGFYNLPDGDFYDPDGYYFNKEGYDEFGGYYEHDNCYVPGEGNKDLINAVDDEDEYGDN